MNKFQEQAQERLEKIQANRKRILRKMKDPECTPRKHAGYKNRLSEYDKSEKALLLTIKSGVPVKVKDEKQQALIAALTGDVPQPSEGVTVPVPSGGLDMEGQ